MAKFTERELFETVPVPRAVATLAVPTVISQVVTMIYNLADTFFIGQLGDPAMVAAVSLVSPWFNLLTALGNLFGLGGSSLISRMLGIKREEDIRYVSTFSAWGGAAVTLCFSLLTFLARGPLLAFLGASPDTYGYAEDYLLWVVVLGGVPTVVSLVLGHLLRSEGHAKEASAGMMFGGILNVILDPVLIFGFQLEVAGAAIATAFSNTASVVFFAVQYARLKGHTAVSFRPKYFTFRFIGPIFSVGLASALATALGNASNMVMVHLASGYGDIPVAAYGIVKRIDQFPLNVSMGLCQGFMPLVGYNYAARNYQRMRSVSYFSWKTAILLSAGFVACFAAFAPPDPPSLYPGGRDQCPGGAVPAGRLSGGSPDSRQLPHQLHAPGYGQGCAVGHPDLQPPGTFEHPSADPDGPDLWAVWHDLDPAGGGGHHAPHIPGDVPRHLPAPACPKGVQSLGRTINHSVHANELFETSPTAFVGLKYRGRAGKESAKCGNNERKPGRKMMGPVTIWTS